MNFQDFKIEILRRAHDAEACQGEYKKAYNSENFEQLLTVIKDNFRWCCENNVLTADLLESVKDDAAKFDLYCNVTVNKGYLIASGSATVEAYGSATVKAFDSATVMAFDSATVMASGSATVKAWGSAKVEAYDSAKVEAYDSATVMAFGSATVEAWGSAYINILSTLEYKISDKAIVRLRDTNQVILAENLKLK